DDRRRLEAKEETLKTLQQGVVELSRDPRPFVDALLQARIELIGESTDSKLMESEQQRERRDYDHCAKPCRLVVGGRDRKIDDGAGFVPHAAVVGRDDAEPIIAWGQVSIERLPTRASILPVGVTALEHDTKSVLLRCDEAQCRIVDLQITDERRQVQGID